MSAVAFIRRCLAVGMDVETALLAAEQFEAAAPTLTPRQARNRRYYEGRKASEASEIETIKTLETASDVSPPSRPLPPQTPLTPTHPPGSVTPRVRGEAFERFWEAYPRKDAKKTARTRFAVALTKTSPDVLMAAVERQRAWEQWQRGFVPHAATWLHQERWTDEEPPPAEPRKAPHERPHHDAKFAARQANHAAAFAGADRASRFRGEP